MKKMFLALSVAIVLSFGVSAQQTVRLPEPDRTGGEPLMQTLNKRHSLHDGYSDRALTPQQLSDLLWAANGINRPDGKRTAPSAMNKQDIALYVCTAEGNYRYEPNDHSLRLVSEGDARQLPAGVNIVLVADRKTDYSGVDAGYVSQNIYLWCASAGLETCARGSGDRKAFAEALRLDPANQIVVWHPVGYAR